MTRIWQLIIACTICLTAFAAAAQETIIGHVRKVTGVATIIRGDERVRVLSGLPVRAKDIIETGSNGAIGVTLSDNRAFSAGPNSRIAMERFSFDSKELQGQFAGPDGSRHYHRHRART